ncbi:MAG: DUF559 domain-containing protein [Chitinispirillaceae bacterium]|jgi:very-short-patch-repair endonuclease
MQTNKVVRYQKVDKVKFQRTKELRRAMTPAEKILWNNVRNGKIGGVKIRRQQIIDGFIADFYCHKARLVIEVDGTIHENEGHKEYDEQRKKVMEIHGLSEIRFSNDEIMSNITQVVCTLNKMVSERIPCISWIAVDE